MSDMRVNHYMEVVDRIKNQTPDFDTNNLHILIAEDKALDGAQIQDFSLSKDKKWICIPFEVDGLFYPKCFEVAGILETFLKYGGMNCSTMIYLLYK